MIKRNNKKGFTIVELVIVIAVIAILAAVLIPTFAGIIKKANISKDTQLAKNLNTILISEEAEGNKPADFSEVLSVLRENGYVVENLNPTTEGCYFVWESASNQIMLVDKDFQIIYVAEALTENTSISATWFFAVKDAELVEAVKTAGGSVVPAVDTAWLQEDVTKLVGLLEKGGVITLSESVTLKTSNNFQLENVETPVTLNLAGQTLTTDYGDAYTRAFHVADSSLAITDGSIVTSATSVNGDPSLWGSIRTMNGATLTVDNVDITFTGLSGLAKPCSVIKTTDSTVTITNTVINFANSMGAEISTGTTATFENVTFKSSGDTSWAGICIGVSGGATANIKSGTYIAATEGAANAGYCVGVLSSGGTLNISGGTFEGNLFIATASNAVADSVINITGGTFDGKAFNSLTEAEWLAKLGDSYGASTVEIAGAGTNNVTIKVAK